MLYRIPKYCLLVILLLISTAAPGQYTFRQIKVEDGLSQSTITSILQDKKGYMWIGTGNGLNKYNGYTFKLYSNVIDDSTSISSNVVTSMFEDSRGILWLGTVDGVLNRYEREAETFTRFNVTSDLKVITIPDQQYYNYPISFSRNNNNSLTSITEDPDGSLWIGTWGKGIIKFNPESGKKIHFHSGTEDNTLSHNRVTRIIKDSYGKIWVGTLGGGLNRITQDKNGIHFKIFKNHQNDLYSLSDNKVVSLYEDREKNIWAGTYTSGLNRIKNIEDENIRFINYRSGSGKNSIASNSVMSVIQDKLGYIWIGTFGGGLDRFDKKTGEFLNFRKNKFDENSLADDDVLIIFEDRSGIIWIGTHLGRGISILEKGKLKFNLLKNTYTENSLNDDVVWAVLKESNHLWIGTYKGGLNRMDKKSNFRYYKHDPSDSYCISDNHIRSISKGLNGELWIGTYSGGLNNFNPSTEKFISYQNDTSDKKSIGGNQVLQVIMAPDSVFWVATFGGGLNYFKYNGSPDKVVFSKYVNDPDDPNSLSDNRVYSILRTIDGTIWAGTFGGGLNKLDAEGKFKIYRNNLHDPGSISHDRVMSVYEDSKGRMWVSTYGGGLNYFDRKTEKFKSYTRKHGLLSDVIYSVLEDNSGNLWISSDNGLFKFYPESERFVKFDIDDGLQNQEFSGGAYFKAEDGQLFFGGISGLNYFYPDSIYENTNIPPVVVSSIRVAGESVKGEVQELKLEYDQNILTFEFAALDFTNPADNRYEYILEGLETSWQRTEAEYRIANYTNLSPGTYYFKVRGSNNDEVWNTEPVVVKVTILPPFWKTWWFLSLSLLAAALVIYFLSTIRIRNLLAIEKLKTKLAADLHDNIGAGLTEISILSEIAANDIHLRNDGDYNKLKTISETARQLVDNMSDIVWVVNPRRDSLNDLLIRIKDSYADILSGMGISLKTFNLEEIEDVKLTMDFKQNLFMILKEGINNSIKHSGCKKIVIQAQSKTDIIEILITDDGKGINYSEIAYGNGLKNIESRAKAIGAKVKWESVPGKGTTLYFTGRIRNKIDIKNMVNNFKELF
jgi:ligand-binding sensor domain-containing protein/anti-sigma regulatory factor (Ser/Thr protein kinase)